ncbi:TetR/AcrR family transcriptional regulator [Microbacterium sp. NPDC091313]
MTSVTEGTSRRLSSEERRAQILEAALAVFGSKGYVGTTTDDVARAASVSQPYVVRLFGSKERLFLDVLEGAVDDLLRAFRAALAADDGTEPQKRMGDAYVDLLRERGLHQTLSHAFLLGAHPVIGPAARRCFTRVWDFVREEAGFDAERARMFLAEGMLINTMIGLRLVDDTADDSGIAELFLACFPTDVREVLDVVPRGDEPW